jgi:hypothetical protein
MMTSDDFIVMPLGNGQPTMRVGCTSESSVQKIRNFPILVATGCPIHRSDREKIPNLESLKLEPSVSDADIWPR